ncbi:hypothetical protein T12_15110 [Trichinella patagoniensis]|uniref:Uncharacterized protein n=1 Tax=Trichinella patagoniensis TaxID=990121 RepID=A0A0V0ZSE2_9BILA|nr:hypothetical protein T12_15110 [Trichinella patagoniensis]
MAQAHDMSWFCYALKKIIIEFQYLFFIMSSKLVLLKPYIFYMPHKSDLKSDNRSDLLCGKSEPQHKYKNA